MFNCRPIAPLRGSEPGIEWVAPDRAKQGQCRFAERLLHAYVRFRGADLRLRGSEIGSLRPGEIDQFADRALGDLLRLKIRRLRDVQLAIGGQAERIGQNTACIGGVAFSLGAIELRLRVRRFGLAAHRRVWRCPPAAGRA